MALFKKSNMTPQDEKFLKEHKGQLKKLLKAQERYCDAVYKDDHIPRPDLFVMPKADIVNMLCQFFSDTITDEWLKKQLMDNIRGRNPNVVVRLLDNPDDPMWHQNGVTGRIEKENVDNKTFFVEDVGKTKLIAHAGINRGNNVVEKHFGHIIGLAHETAHSASQKHNGEHFVQPNEDCLGEIESIFTEKLLLEYLYTNAEKISNILQNKGFDRVSADWLQRQVAIKRKSMNIDLKNHLSRLLQEQSGDNSKSYIYRYVVGEVYANLMLDAYRKNPENIIHNFSEFVKVNSDITLDQATKIITGGARQSQNEIFEDFIKQQQRKMQAHFGDGEPDKL